MYENAATPRSQANKNSHFISVGGEPASLVGVFEMTQSANVPQPKPIIHIAETTNLAKKVCLEEIVRKYRRLTIALTRAAEGRVGVKRGVRVLAATLWRCDILQCA